MPPKQAADIQPQDEDTQEEGGFQCTACEEYITTSFDAYLHPLLKCLVCRKCHKEYKTGDFSLFEGGVDEDGVDNYCRWCVDGGNLFQCSNIDSDNQCHYVFCQECIERNVPNDPVRTASEQDKKFNWVCYSCDPSPLKELRKEAQEAILELSQKDLKRTKEATSACSQGHGSQKGSGDKTTSSLNHTSRKDSENTTPPESPAVTNKSKRDDKGLPTARGTDRDVDDTSGSERKKRRTETSGSTSVSTAPEPERRESLTRKDKDKKKEEDVAREPESYLKPALEKPKPPKTSLRNLARPSGLPSVRPPVPTPGATQHSSATKQPQASGNSIPARSSLPNGPAAKASQLPSSATKHSTQAPAQKASSSATATNAAPRPKTTTITTVDSTDLIKTSGQTPKLSFVSRQNLRPVSKALKPSNEQIRPTTKVALNEQDLKARLETYGSIKDKCVKEINIKFQNILEMFIAKDLDNKSIIKSEIEDLERPMQEINTMLVNLKSLYSSQN